MSNHTANITVTKASGEKVLFDVSRLRHSLEQSGASEAVISQIITKVTGELYEGITTGEIYKKAFSLLRRNSNSNAARYKLKKALFELGPTGFPFEKFVAAILEYEGFRTKTDLVIEGHCVNHEVDVVAEKENNRFMVECKFHSDQGRYCDVKIPLYIQSRFKDVEQFWKNRSGEGSKFHQGWIFTNTRFTIDAIQYGKCSGLMLIGWDQPKKGSLKERIDVSGLHPITSLTTINKNEKQQLLEKGKVLCMELCDHPELIDAIGIPKRRHKKILEEASDLCNR